MIYLSVHTCFLSNLDCCEETRWGTAVCLYNLYSSPCTIVISRYSYNSTWTTGCYSGQNFRSCKIYHFSHVLSKFNETWIKRSLSERIIMTVQEGLFLIRFAKKSYSDIVWGQDRVIMFSNAYSFQEIEVNIENIRSERGRIGSKSFKLVSCLIDWLLACLMDINVMSIKKYV